MAARYMSRATAPPLLNVIDTASDKVTGTIEVGKAPHGLALTPDGRLLLAAINGEDKVALIDTHTQAVVATLPVAKPHTVAVRPDGKVAYVSSQLAGSFALVVIDLKKRAIARSVPLGQQPRDIEFGHDGKALYFTLAGVDAVQVLDPATDKVGGAGLQAARPRTSRRSSTPAKFGTAVVQGPGRAAAVRREEECAAAFDSGGDEAALAGERRWQDRLRDQRRFERCHRGGSRHIADEDECCRQCAAQDRRAARGYRGILSRNTEPRGSCASTLICPPWACAMRRASDRPMPEPPGLVV